MNHEEILGGQSIRWISRDNIPSFREVMENPVPAEALNTTHGYLYFLFLNGHIVYVGQTINPSTRIISHFKDKEFDSFKVFAVADMEDLADLETYFTLRYKPRYCKAVTTGRRYLSRKQAQDYTRLGRNAFERAVRIRNIPAYVFRGKPLYHIEDLKRLNDEFQPLRGGEE